MVRGRLHWTQLRTALRIRQKTAQTIHIRFNSTQSKAPRTIFSGIQPTGTPHLGNYLGALRQWVKLQNDAASDTTLLYSIVDLHALTTQEDPTYLRQWRREMLAALLAVGLNPERSTIFYQSTVLHSRMPPSRLSLLFPGPRTCRVNVDLKYQCVNGISFTNDSMEGAMN